ncbi:MAG TPA: dihydroorotate dehydrogenase [Firmicutes bacterium]|nr:dihydroorotate dehydrogenase [Bacillota bacterium]
MNEMIDIGGAKLKNPFMSASGCFGYGREFAQIMDLQTLGAIVVKGVSLDPWLGNKGVRVAETPSGMLNAIGLENPGLDYFLENHLPFLLQKDLSVVVNIVGKTLEEYVEVARRLNDTSVSALEINISCPNVAEGGIAFGTSPEKAYEIISSIRKVTELPLWVKLSPNVTDIVEIAKAVEAAGADALTLINTLTGMVIDIETGKPLLGNLTGGLSGPAIKPIAVRMVYQVASEVNIPIVGVGGITSLNDALEFFMAGASAVQIGSALFRDPLLLERLPKELERYLIEKNTTLEQIIGLARRSV